MTDIITRLESADGPDRELFMQAYAACFPELRFDGHPQRFMSMLDAEAWTSAAEILVPEGWKIQVTTWDNFAEAIVAKYSVHDGSENSNSGAPTPALALAAAALKARHQPKEPT